MLIKLHQTGDTIIEVLIATVIIGVILAGGFVASNASAVADRQSQERSIVLGLLQSQIEELKTRTVAEVNAAPAKFCAVNSTSGISLQDATVSGNCSFDSSNNNHSGTEPVYNIAVTSIPSITNPGVYTIQANATWLRAGGNGSAGNNQDTMTLAYKLFAGS